MEAHNASLGGGGGYAPAPPSDISYVMRIRLDVLAFGGTGPSWVTNMAPFYTRSFSLLIESCFHR